MTEPYDLFVIGGGSGGVRAARFAASFGARVGIAERSAFGGTCVHRGCVPKKLLVHAAEYADAFHEARGYGFAVPEVGHDWAALVAANVRETDRLGGLYRAMLEKAGVEIHEGDATIVGPGRVEVGGAQLEARKVLIATGSHAARLAVPGGELGMTSDEAFRRGTLPRSIVVVGGGYIAVEFAGVYRALGAEVHLVHRGPTLLDRFDDDVAAHVTAAIAARGVTLHLGRTVASIARGGAGLVVTLDDGHTLEGEDVLQATGRLPNTRGLGLEAAGVALSARGAVVVDEEFVSSAPWVLAVGDVIDRAQLTPVALAEGMYVARRHFGGLTPPHVDYALIPTAVFSRPSIGTVGLTEREAKLRHEVRVFRGTFRPLQHAHTGRAERALVKLVVDAVTDRVLGVHVVSDHAGEIVQGFAVALQCGATKAQFDATIGIHPTAAEELVTLRS